MADTLNFRALTAEDIEVRVGTCGAKGVSLLLYKDARCDMAILDETVGPLNWKREHSNGNANCTVSIFNEKTGQWIAKEDTGTESFTEKEKGLASDSFKRACVNWGIGRELYTAPFLWFSSSEVNLVQNGGKCTTRDRFVVNELEVKNGRITKVTITDSNTKKAKTFYQAAPTKATQSSNSATSAPVKAQATASPAKSTPAKQTSAPVDLGGYKITTKCNKQGMTLEEIFHSEGGVGFLERLVKFQKNPEMQADAKYAMPFLKSKGIEQAS